MKSFIKIFIGLSCGLELLVSPCNAMGPDNTVTNPVAFGQQILREWGIQLIEHSFFGSSQPKDCPVILTTINDIAFSTEDAIFFGTRWKQFADNPEMIKAMLGHEAMHLIHGDTSNRSLFFLKNILPYLFRMLESHLYTQGFISVADSIFGQEETSGQEKLDITGRTKLISFFVPIGLGILKYFSSSKVFEKIAQSTDPEIEISVIGLLTIFNFFPTFFSTLIEAPTFYQNMINTVSSYLQNTFSFLTSNIEPFVKASITILLSLAAWWLAKRLILYPAFAYSRAVETAADVDSASRFGITQGLIALFTRSKELWPEENILLPLDTHPTLDARIAALQAL